MKAPVNWNLLFIDANRGLGMCKSQLFLVE